MYRYFIYKYTYRFVNVLQQFVKAYKAVNSALGMAPAVVTDKHILEIWTRLNDMRSRVPVEEINSMWDSLLKLVKKK
jgi:N-methylhydantoinase A/oxoprolinase/acetone carboxylase beta subunit